LGIELESGATHRISFAGVLATCKGIFACFGSFFFDKTKPIIRVSAKGQK
jgi:hypothetical protein